MEEIAGGYDQKEINLISKNIVKLLSENFKIAPKSRSLGETAKNIFDKVPKPNSINKNSIKASLNSLKRNLKQIGMGENDDVIGSCQKIVGYAEERVGGAVEMSSKLMEEAQNLVGNLEAVIEVMEESLSSLKDVSEKDKQIAYEVHKETMKVLNENVSRLKDILGKKSQKDSLQYFLSEIKRYGTDFESKIEDRKALTRALKSLAGTAFVLDHLYEVAKEIGISKEQLKKIANSSDPRAELGITITDSIENLGSGVQDLFKKISYIRDALVDKDVKKMIKGKGEGEFEANSEDKTGGDPTSGYKLDLDDVMAKGQKQTEEQGIVLLIAFHDSISGLFTKLASLGDKIAKAITGDQFNDNSLLAFRNALKAVPDFNIEDFYVLSGAVRDYKSELYRAGFLGKLKNFIYEAEQLKKENPKIKELDEFHKVLKQIEEVILTYNKQFHEGFGTLSKSSLNSLIVGSEGFGDYFKKGVDFVKKGVKVVGDVANTIDRSMGETIGIYGKGEEKLGGAVDDFRKKFQILVARQRQVGRMIYDFKQLKQLINNIIKGRQMLQGLKFAAENQEALLDGYDKINAKTIAYFKDQISKKMGTEKYRVVDTSSIPSNYFDKEFLSILNSAKRTGTVGEPSELYKVTVNGAVNFDAATARAIGPAYVDINRSVLGKFNKKENKLILDNVTLNAATGSYVVPKTINATINPAGTTLTTIDNIMNSLSRLAKAPGDITVTLTKIDSNIVTNNDLVDDVKVYDDLSNNLDTLTENNLRTVNVLGTKKLGELYPYYLYDINMVHSNDSKGYFAFTNMQKAIAVAQKLNSILNLDYQNEIYQSQIDLLEAAEALDMYFKAFSEIVTSKPKDIKSIFADLETKVTINEWKSKSLEGVIDDIRVAVTAAEHTDKKEIFTNRIFEYFKHQSALKIVLSLFFRIGEDIGGEQALKKTFMSPNQFYDIMIRFLAYNPVEAKISDSLNLHKLLQDMLNSIAGKVLFALDVHKLVTTPGLYGARGAMSISRMIMGGEDAKIKVEAMEIYYRVPLLIEFYKEIFKTTIISEAPYSFAFVPSTKGQFAELFRVVWNNDGNFYSNEKVNIIIENCNSLYLKYKSCDVILKAIIHEVNSRIGIISTSSFTISRDFYEKNKIFDEDNFGKTKDIDRVDYDILRDLDGPSGTAPSSQHTTVTKMLRTQDKSIRLYQNQVKKIVNKLLNTLKKNYNDTLGLTPPASEILPENIDLAHYIRTKKTEFLESSESRKQDIVVSLINNVGYNEKNFKVNASYLMHELVTNPINNCIIIEKIIDILKSKVKAINGTNTVYKRFENTKIRDLDEYKSFEFPFSGRLNDVLQSVKDKGNSFLTKMNKDKNEYTTYIHNLYDALTKENEGLQFLTFLAETDKFIKEVPLERVIQKVSADYPNTDKLVENIYGGNSKLVKGGAVKSLDKALLLAKVIVHNGSKRSGKITSNNSVVKSVLDNYNNLTNSKYKNVLSLHFALDLIIYLVRITNLAGGLYYETPAVLPVATVNDDPTDALYSIGENKKYVIKTVISADNVFITSSGLALAKLIERDYLQLEPYMNSLEDFLTVNNPKQTKFKLNDWKDILPIITTENYTHAHEYSHEINSLIKEASNFPTGILSGSYSYHTSSIKIATRNTYDTKYANLNTFLILFYNTILTVPAAPTIFGINYTGGAVTPVSQNLRTGANDGAVGILALANVTPVPASLTAISLEDYAKPLFNFLTAYTVIFYINNPNQYDIYMMPNDLNIRNVHAEMNIQMEFYKIFCQFLISLPKNFLDNEYSLIEKICVILYYIGVEHKNKGLVTTMAGVGPNPGQLNGLHANNTRTLPTVNIFNNDRRDFIDTIFTNISKVRSVMGETFKKSLSFNIKAEDTGEFDKEIKKISDKSLNIFSVLDSSFKDNSKELKSFALDLTNIPNFLSNDIAVVAAAADNNDVTNFWSTKAAAGGAQQPIHVAYETAFNKYLHKIVPLKQKIIDKNNLILTAYSLFQIADEILDLNEKIIGFAKTGFPTKTNAIDAIKVENDSLKADIAEKFKKVEKNIYSNINVKKFLKETVADLLKFKIVYKIIKIEEEVMGAAAAANYANGALGFTFRRNVVNAFDEYFNGKITRARVISTAARAVLGAGVVENIDIFTRKFFCLGNSNYPRYIYSTEASVTGKGVLPTVPAAPAVGVAGAATDRIIEHRPLSVSNNLADGNSEEGLYALLIHNAVSLGAAAPNVAVFSPIPTDRLGLSRMQLAEVLLNIRIIDDYFYSDGSIAKSQFVNLTKLTNIINSYTETGAVNYNSVKEFARSIYYRMDGPITDVGARSSKINFKEGSVPGDIISNYLNNYADGYQNNYFTTLQDILTNIYLITPSASVRVGPAVRMDTPAFTVAGILTATNFRFFFADESYLNPLCGAITDMSILELINLASIDAPISYRGLFFKLDLSDDFTLKESDDVQEFYIHTNKETLEQLKKNDVGLLTAENDKHLYDKIESIKITSVTVAGVGINYDPEVASATYAHPPEVPTVIAAAANLRTIIYEKQVLLSNLDDKAAALYQIFVHYLEGYKSKGLEINTKINAYYIEKASYISELICVKMMDKVLKQTKDPLIFKNRIKGFIANYNQKIKGYNGIKDYVENALEIRVRNNLTRIESRIPQKKEDLQNFLQTFKRKVEKNTKVSETQYILASYLQELSAIEARLNRVTKEIKEYDNSLTIVNPPLVMAAAVRLNAVLADPQKNLIDFIDKLKDKIKECIGAHYVKIMIDDFNTDKDNINFYPRFIGADEIERIDALEESAEGEIKEKKDKSPINVDDFVNLLEKIKEKCKRKDIEPPLVFDYLFALNILPENKFEMSDHSVMLDIRKLDHDPIYDLFVFIDSLENNVIYSQDPYSKSFSLNSGKLTSNLKSITSLSYDIMHKLSPIVMEEGNTKYGDYSKEVENIIKDINENHESNKVIGEIQKDLTKILFEDFATSKLNENGVKNYTKYYYTNIEQEFRNLVKDMLDNICEKRFEFANNVSIPYYLYYKKLIDPLLLGPMNGDIKLKQSIYMSKDVFSAITRTNDKTVDLKPGVRKFVIDSWGDVESFMKENFKTYIPYYKYMFNLLKKKSEYYKTWSTFYNKNSASISDNRYQDLIIMCTTVVNSLNSIIEDIKGSDSKYQENFLEIYPDFFKSYPNNLKPSSIASNISHMNVNNYPLNRFDRRIMYGLRPLFNDTKISKTNYQGIYELIEKYNSLVGEGERNVKTISDNVFIDLFEKNNSLLKYMISNSSKRSYDFNQIMGALPNNIVNNVRNNGLLKSYINEEKASYGILESTDVSDKVRQIASSTLLVKPEDQVSKDILKFQNIIDKNLVPFNLRVIHRSVALAYITLFAINFENAIGLDALVPVNPFTLKGLNLYNRVNRTRPAAGLTAPPTSTDEFGQNIDSYVNPKLVLSEPTTAAQLPELSKSTKIIVRNLLILRDVILDSVTFGDQKLGIMPEFLSITTDQSLYNKDNSRIKGRIYSDYANNIAPNDETF